MRLGPWCAAGLLVSIVVFGGSPVGAAEPVATVLTLTGAAAYADSSTTLDLQLQTDQAAPVPAADLSVDRRIGGDWQPIATLVTDADGRAELVVVLARTADDNVFRAAYAGDADHDAAATGPVQIALLRRNSTVSLSGPDSVVDETSVTLRVRWVTQSGLPVAGRVTVSRRKAGGVWEEFGRLTTGPEGRASLTVGPRVDTKWRARGHGMDWVAGADSKVHPLDNLPPGVPVTLPARAPKPIRLPTQARAVGSGANPVTTVIPRRIWRQMKGRSWHRGCPVGRASLRWLRINYWGFDGYRHRGELVAHASAVGSMADALTRMYADRLPLRSMYRVDRFGWSATLHGGDNYASMAADNTSAFNCRWVVGRPGVLSPHAYGYSLDLNPWENPYLSDDGPVPNSWWVTRSHPRVAWRSLEHAVVDAMQDHGLRWTYGLQDPQHFDVPR